MSKLMIFISLMVGISPVIIGSPSSFYPSGSAEIDSIRKGLSAYPTESSNYRER